MIIDYGGSSFTLYKGGTDENKKGTSRVSTELIAGKMSEMMFGR